MPNEEVRHRLGVLEMTLHAEAERLDPLQRQERVERRGGGAQVSKQLHASLDRVRTGAERRVEGEAVIGRIGVDHAAVFAVCGVVEASALDDGAADRGGVAADELGGRVNDDVGAPLDRVDAIGRRHGVVDDERNPEFMGERRDALDVEHVVSRVGEHLTEVRPGVLLGGVAPLIEVVGILDEGHLDAELGQSVMQQVVGSAVQRRRRHEVLPRLHDVEDGQRRSRLPRGHRKRAGQPDRRGERPFERGESGLENALGGVHETGVDVADLAEREKVGRMIGVTELIGGRLIDRHDRRASGRIRLLTGVDLPGLETP